MNMMRREKNIKKIQMELLKMKNRMYEKIHSKSYKKETTEKRKSVNLNV